MFFQHKSFEKMVLPYKFIRLSLRSTSDELVGRIVLSELHIQITFLTTFFTFSTTGPWIARRTGRRCFYQQGGRSCTIAGSATLIMYPYIWCNTISPYIQVISYLHGLPDETWPEPSPSDPLSLVDQVMLSVSPDQYVHPFKHVRHVGKVEKKVFRFATRWSHFSVKEWNKGSCEQRKDFSRGHPLYLLFRSGKTF